VKHGTWSEKLGIPVLADRLLDAQNGEGTRMSEQENTQRVRDAYATWERGDLPSFLETVADDIEWVVPGPADLPFTGTYRGKQAVQAWFAALGPVLEFTVFEVQGFIAQGNTVAALIHEEATVRQTGREYVDNEVHVWTFRDGKLVHWQEYYDTAAVAAAYRGQ
jgi:ketosteroid isomerase-like protein